MMEKLKQRASDMAQVSVSEGAVTIPKWLVIIIVSLILIPAVVGSGRTVIATQAAAERAQETADIAVKDNIKQDERLDKLEAVVIDTTTMKGDIGNLKTSMGDLKTDMKTLIRMHMKGAPNER